MKTSSDRIARALRAILLLLVAAAAGCTSSNGYDVRTYRVRGEVIGFENQRGRLILAHENIPGFMNAMTMAFRLKDSSLLHTFAVGDSIAATLVIKRDLLFLDSIAVTWHAAQRAPESVHP
jgi:protein SCO1/2